jgi:hypothetical protein
MGMESLCLVKKARHIKASELTYVEHKKVDHKDVESRSRRKQEVDKSLLTVTKL